MFTQRHFIMAKRLFFSKRIVYFLFDLYTFYKLAFFHLYKKKQIAGAAKAEVVICTWKINVKKGLVKEWLFCWQQSIAYIAKILPRKRGQPKQAPLEISFRRRCSTDLQKG